MTHWTELVELYEYKVADTLGGRVPRGGKRALAELRAELLDAPLESVLYRRVIEADRQLRAFTKSGVAPHPLPPRVIQSVPEAAWQAPVAADPEEATAWDELRRMAWHDRALRELQRLCAQWSQELNLLSLRVLYTASENAERLQHPGQHNLPVPSASDPLVSLLDRGVLQELVQTLAATLYSRDGVARLRSAFSELHETPFPRHPEEDVLASRIEAVQRERRTIEERESLIRALQEQYPLPRDPRERPAIREAVRAVVQKLEPLLSSAPPASQGSVPPRSILYATRPELAQIEADDASDELVVSLHGGQAVHWRGVDWRWQFIQPNWQLQADRQLLLLRPKDPPTERHAQVNHPRGKFKVFVSGAFLLIHAEVSPAEELGRRAALGRAVSLLLDPSDDHAYLRLARATAQLLRDGQVDVRALSPRSADRYKVASDEALHNFARKGVTSLLARLLTLTPAQAAQAVSDAGRAIALDAGRSARLTETLHLAQHEPATLPSPVSATHIELPLSGAFVSLHLPDEPLTLLVGGRAVTLRHDFQGRLAAVMAGHPAQYLHDLLVLRLPEVSVVLARHGRWLAATATLDEPEGSATPRHPTLLVGPGGAQDEAGAAPDA